MIILDNTKYGTKRKAIIGGVNFDILQKTLQVSFYIQLIDASGNLLEDLSINQNRSIGYNLTNQKNVDTQFNYVTTGGKGEYNYFFELMQTTPLPTLILQLAEKLKTRGLFN